MSAAMAVFSVLVSIIFAGVLLALTVVCERRLSGPVSTELVPADVASVGDLELDVV